MHDIYKRRVAELQRRMKDAGLDGFLLTDPDSVYHLTAYWGYLGMEFGRPTMLLVMQADAPTLITPTMEQEMARAMTWVEDIRTWRDGADHEWVGHLRDLLGGAGDVSLAIERFQIHPRVLDALAGEAPGAHLRDGSDVLAEMRMIKGPEDIAILRQGGRVAVAMVEAGVAAIGEGVPEYEIALAVIAGGTRKAAEILASEGGEPLASPVLHFHQILKSGGETSMMHRRSTTRRIRRGDPVFMCCCGITEFKHVKLGFDRTTFLGEIGDRHAEWGDVARRVQAAALDAIRPGVAAEDVHAAAKEVMREAGYEMAGRTGRAIGYSYLEKPELSDGDKTPLRPGMALAVDGNLTIPGTFACQFGDSVIVTEDGYETLTDYPREIRVV